MFRYMFTICKNAGLSDIYGFMDPQFIHQGNKFDDTQAYMMRIQPGRKKKVTWFSMKSSCHNFNSRQGVTLADLE